MAPTPVPLAVLNERAIRRHLTHPWLGSHPDPTRRSVLRLPVAGELLFTSHMDGCLTHITRLVCERANGRRSPTALCGTINTRCRWIDPADETFVCIRCDVAAQRWGVSTFGLVPDTGCAISGGRRGRGRRR